MFKKKNVNTITASLADMQAELVAYTAERDDELVTLTSKIRVATQERDLAEKIADKLEALLS